MQITTVGLDMAKSMFQIHGVSAEGQVAIRRKLRRSEVPRFFHSLSPCLVGLEPQPIAFETTAVLDDGAGLAGCAGTGCSQTGPSALRHAARHMFLQLW